MADIEKTIRALKTCLTDDCDGCPYYVPEEEMCLRGDMLRETLELLEKARADWRCVEKDGNPDAEGMYHVILIYSGWDSEKREPNGELYATREARWFGDAVKAGFENWVMRDQPDHGLVWTEETGSYPNERVYAWLPRRDYPDIELPEGVKWDD